MLKSSDGFGMVNYVGVFIPHFANITAVEKPSKTDLPWSRAQPQETAFQEIKKFITNAPVLTFYDSSKEL